MNRKLDWLAQGKLDLRHARNSIEMEDYNWACFAAQQGAEKAIKALYLHLNMEGWGHSVRKLLEEISEEFQVPLELIEMGRKLDQYYIPTRYPNGFDVGKPADYYSQTQSSEALSDAEKILNFCEKEINSQKIGG